VTAGPSATATAVTAVPTAGRPVPSQPLSFSTAAATTAVQQQLLPVSGTLAAAGPHAAASSAGAAVLPLLSWPPQM